jgi:hypothetical protein
LVCVLVVLALALHHELWPDIYQATWKPKRKLFSRFFDRESALLPMTTGLVLLAAGGYGLLVASNYQGPDWMLYSGLLLTGLLVLKRTFSTSD